MQVSEWRDIVVCLLTHVLCRLWVYFSLILNTVKPLHFAALQFCDFVRKFIFVTSGLRRTTKQPHLSTVTKSWCFSQFHHTAWMPGETHAKKDLTASSLENWRRPLDTRILRGWRLPSRTWSPIKSAWMKQLMWLRIEKNHPLLVLRARNKWMNEDLDNISCNNVSVPVSAWHDFT